MSFSVLNGISDLICHISNIRKGKNINVRSLSKLLSNSTTALEPNSVLREETGFKLLTKIQGVEIGRILEMAGRKDLALLFFHYLSKLEMYCYNYYLIIELSPIPIHNRYSKCYSLFIPFFNPIHY
jgi:hypothetical protein